MKTIRTAPAQVTGVQVAAGRRAYSAPQLTTFGAVAALTAGGSGGNREAMVGGMNVMRARI